MRPIHTDDAPAAIGPYSQAMVAGGLLFCSGQIPMDPATGAIVGEDVAAQTEQVFANLRAVLHAAGTRLDHVAKCTVFLKNMNDFAAMNEVYARHFDGHRPARAAVEVSRLPKDVLVEIEAIALVDMSA